MKLESMEPFLKEVIDDLSVYIERAYTPYSNFKVACALICNNKRVIKGVNVENASYGLTMCAERNAIGTAIGMNIVLDNVDYIVVYHQDKCISPCGACAQVITELLKPDVKVIMASESGYKICEGKELLPFQFSREDLK